MKVAVALFAVLLLCVAVGRARANAPITIYLANKASEVTQAQLDDQLPAIQRAVEVFGSFWGVDATVVDRNPQPGDWVLNLTDVPGPCVLFSCILGYHWHKGSTVYAVVFVQSITSFSASVTQTETHEIFEMLADPNGERAIRSQQQWWRAEVCDPVNDWSWYEPGADGKPVAISDFVTPDWFSGGAGPYDQLNKIRRTLQLAPGGTAAYWVRGSGWTLKTNRSNVAQRPSSRLIWRS